MNTLSFTVSAEEGGMRLDRFLAENAEDMTRSFLQKLIRDGAVSVNGKQEKASFSLPEGAEVTLQVPEAASLELALSPVRRLFFFRAQALRLPP